ncbi:MAG TPA: kinase, partial [Gammaproteobacteria bacterium]|nr:kinase [Gammaproteobacteria bacterium]
MLDPDGLNVWSDQQLVGYLWRNTQGLIGFRYEEEWLAQGEFAISHTLPLQQEDFTPEDSLAHRFFANLLPEGGVRDQIVRDLKIANTDFDL